MFRRIGGLVRRRIVPIAIGFAILAVVFLVTVGTLLPGDGVRAVLAGYNVAHVERIDFDVGSPHFVRCLSGQPGRVSR